MTVYAEDTVPVSVFYSTEESTQSISASIKKIGTITVNKLDGDVFLVSLPANSKIENISFVAPDGVKVSTQLVNNQNKFITSNLLKEYNNSSNYLVNGEFISTNTGSVLYKQFTSVQTLEPANALPTQNVKGFVVRQVALKTRVDVLYVQIANPPQEVNKTALGEAIASALPTSGYYTENDRWNGRISSEKRVLARS